MAYVSSFVYCDTIQIQTTPNGPQHQIINPIQVLIPVGIPSNFSFSISCSIAGFVFDADHRVEIMFVDPAKKELIKPADITFNTSKENLQGKNKRVPVITINMDLRNVILSTEGTYATIVKLDDEVLGEYKIDVKKAE